LREADIRIVLVHPNTVILPELANASVVTRNANSRLERLRFETETRVTGFSDYGVELAGGEANCDQTLVWTAGATPPAVLRDLPCRKEKGPHRCGGDFGSPRLFPEFGRLAIAPGFPIPGLANLTRQPRSTRCGRPVRGAKNNRGRNFDENEKKPFVFTTLGQLATIGRRTGVANILGIQVIRLFCVVLVADNLPRQTAALRNEAARGIRLDFGTVFSRRTSCNI